MSFARSGAARIEPLLEAQDRICGGASSQQQGWFHTDAL
jgi:hypothetical protein